MGEASKANIVADIRTRELGRDTTIQVEDAGETRIIHHFTGDHRDWFQVLGPDEAARLAAALAAQGAPADGAGAGTAAPTDRELAQIAYEAWLGLVPDGWRPPEASIDDIPELDRGLYLGVVRAIRAALAAGRAGDE